MKSAYAQKSESSQSVTTHDASCVDDRRTLPVAQRVLERESGVVQREGEANGKFKYVENLENNSYITPHMETSDGRIILGTENPVFKSKLPNERGKIVFSRYNNTSLQSPQFSGCLMMAFCFNKVNSEGVDQTESLKELLCGDDLDAFEGSDKYIAHVFTDPSLDFDTKSALCDAKKRKLITIEKLFKPFTEEDSCVMKSFFGSNPLLLNQITFTGELTYDSENGWNAGVYVPDVGVHRIYDMIKSRSEYESFEKVDSKHLLKSFDSHELDRQTKATMAFVYASAGDYVKMRKKLSHKINGEHIIDNGLFELFLKNCSLRVLEQVQRHVPEKKSAIAKEIASRKKEEEKVDRMSPPENPGCCIIS